MSLQIQEEMGWHPQFGVDFIHPCALHGEDEGWYTYDPETKTDRIPYCPDCGKMLNIETCPWCGANWLSYGTSRDDLFADACVTSAGDLCCASCYDEDENDEWEQGEGDDLGWEYYQGE